MQAGRPFQRFSAPTTSPFLAHPFRAGGEDRKHTSYSVTWRLGLASWHGRRRTLLKLRMGYGPLVPGATYPAPFTYSGATKLDDSTVDPPPNYDQPAKA